MDIGMAIKEIRLSCLLSQTDFAKELGVSFSTVNRWETGKSVPSFKTLKRIKGFCENRSLDIQIAKFITTTKSSLE